MALLPEFDPADVGAGRGLIDRLTADAAALQRDVLTEILRRNSHTEYLRGFLDRVPPGASAADLREAFKERVPVSEYEDIKPYVRRIASGEPSSILCSEPITHLLTSSGTSGGQLKLFPSTAEKLDQRLFYNGVQALLRKMHLHPDQGDRRGKGMYLMFIFPGSLTSSGLPIMASSSAYYHSSQFREHDIGGFGRCTSPIEAVLCPDGRQSMYCQLLCGLLDRGVVDHVGGTFANAFIRGIQFLEDNWEEMCSNIRTGRLSDWIAHAPLRDAVAARHLRGPDPALADEIASECARKPWDGIVRRLWPGARYILAIVTGSMSQYIPVLESYGAGLPLVSPMYVCTECAAGINLNPLDLPSAVSYALLPNIAYFEFAEVTHGDDEKVQASTGLYDNLGKLKLVDLVDVKIGRRYELVVTTFAGLYRYRVGDLLTVSGFYNATPLFRFTGRCGVILKIDYESISEEDLLKAISQAYELHLRPLGYMLGGSTAYADISTLPGHYVLFWELATAEGNHVATDIDRTVMENCCLAVEECFDQMYRESRRRGSITALEIRVLERGAFDALMDLFLSRGTSASQYKTPTAIRSEQALLVLEERVSGKYFSQETPNGPL
ncbi:hypothetical protein CFC21_061177 [Triticum aestivum]|uniref:Uncharacterized protein n=2 Tax=Triticum aestivum TaxID=4565 RepID=A0A3B6JIG8_WHEAT|nr:probable indole-3-acetic acid-amido synthetase GH3.7 [Triticum aestivum]XP_044377777.1 probable indole-3-acetic acid-amido synthetase GH3.7 [Triticum aestivum]KAF7053199.1 hypothetical protein CFC21_061177 [Triticum aestivum]